MMVFSVNQLLHIIHRVLKKVNSTNCIAKIFMSENFCGIIVL